MKNVADLRELITPKIKSAIHGKIINTTKNNVNLANYLGIVNLGEDVSESDIDGTIIDANNKFWDDYYKSIDGDYATKELSDAIRTMISDGTIDISFPYKNDSDIIYVEVSEDDTQNEFKTTCIICDNSITGLWEITPSVRGYTLNIDISCKHCGYSDEYTDVL